MLWINSVSLIIDAGKRRGRRAVGRGSPLALWGFVPALPHQQCRRFQRIGWPMEQQVCATRTICLIGINKTVLSGLTKIASDYRVLRLRSAARRRGIVT
jgi:hypothetical protein